MDEPVDAPTLRRILRQVLAQGNLAFTRHALQEMANDDLSEADIVNVLRAGRYDGCDFEQRSWRYRVATALMVVVVALRSEHRAVVVTAWRT